MGTRQGEARGLIHPTTSHGFRSHVHARYSFLLNATNGKSPRFDIKHLQSDGASEVPAEVAAAEGGDQPGDRHVAPSPGHNPLTQS